MTQPGPVLTYTVETPAAAVRRTRLRRAKRGALTLAMLAALACPSPVRVSLADHTAGSTGTAPTSTTADVEGDRSSPAGSGQR